MPYSYVNGGFVSLKKEKPTKDSPKRVVVLPPDEPRKGLEDKINERLAEFFEHRVQALQQMPDDQHNRFVERFCITVSVGLACALSSLFYWVLPPLVRVLVVPIFIGAAWWLGATVVAKFFKLQEIDAFDKILKALELRYLFHAVTFSGLTFAIAAIPFIFIPGLYDMACENADARTLFLCMFTWNLIGAPLFAQARDRHSKEIIVYIFAVPVIVATICWVITNPTFHF